MRVVYTRRSQADLEEIFDRGLQWGRPLADRVERRIRRECDALARFPELGVKTDFEDIRRLPIVRYPLTIYYRIDVLAPQLEILRVVWSKSIRNLDQVP